uniref:HAT C-terminal dimerisation domain-containing protein n=1 Tax=Amphimedon queenslandica TaxID=400682 RepID=A0A1X7UKB6_AMPQE
MSYRLHNFLKTLFGKFVSVRVIKEADDMTAVAYEERKNQLDDNALHIGLVTRSLLRKLHDEVTSQIDKAAKYAISNLPLHDETLLSAQFLNFDTRETAIFSQVEHFLNRYPTLLNFSSPSELFSLSEDFTSFQLLERNDIPDRVWDSAIVSQQDDGGDIRRYFRMVIIWSHISTMRSSDGSFLYGRLAKVTLLVLVIPHSNAEEERVFSLITKNKTGFRPSLKLDGTLSIIIQMKLANPEPCHRYEPMKEVIGKAKTATMTYNKAHSSSASSASTTASTSSSS